MSDITTLDDSAPAAAAATSPDAAILIKHNDDLSGERALLTIHAEQGPGGSHAVFIGLNGVGYQVPRAKPFNVPIELVHNLQAANYTHYERDDQGRSVERVSPRFAYTVMPAVSLGKAAAAKSAKK